MDVAVGLLGTVVLSFVTGFGVGKGEGSEALLVGRLMTEPAEWFEDSMDVAGVGARPD
jgi:hypothetical protein